MTEGAAKLLRELAVLLSRHRPEEFEELARLLGRTEFANTLTRILAELAKTRRGASGRTREPRLGEILEEIREGDPMKYALLRDAQERLFDKRGHLSLADLAELLQSSGISLPKGSFRRREDIVLAFVRSASAMRTEDIAQALSKITVGTTDSELRNWSRMIVPKKHVGKSD